MLRSIRTNQNMNRKQDSQPAGGYIWDKQNYIVLVRYVSILYTYYVVYTKITIKIYIIHCESYNFEMKSEYYDRSGC